MLLAAGAQPTAALDACCLGYTFDALDTARVLLAAGASFAQPKVCLERAISNHQLEIAEMILATGEKMPKGLKVDAPGTKAFVVAHGG